MGCTTKENFMNVIKMNSQFTKAEINFIDSNIETHKELGDDIVLKLGTINKMEEKGLLPRFYNLCKTHKFFPKWVENVDNGIDSIK